MEYFTYILKNNSNSKKYYGHTNNLTQRLKIHNAGKVTYTKPFIPWEIIYFKKFSSKSEAYKRELFFKSYNGYKWFKEQNII